MLDAYVNRLTTQRWLARAPRTAACVAFAALALLGLRGLLAEAPPTSRSTPLAERRDAEAEALAESFARDYLTWDGDRAPDTLRGSVPGVDRPDPPRGVRQRVTWTAVASVGRSGPRSIVVVSARTTNGPVSLAVPVVRDRTGTPQIDGQPAVVSSPPARERPTGPPASPVVDPRLEATVARALRNYLARDVADLSADLVQGVGVLPPDVSYRLRSIDELSWATEGTRVAASVRVVDSARVEQSLRYELAVVRVAGRWLIRAVQTQPTPEVTP